MLLTKNMDSGTFAALGIKEELTSAAEALQPIVNMCKLRLPKPTLRLPEGNAEEDHTFGVPAEPCLEARRQIVFVRLRRHERANQVVLSSAEKYSNAKAMLDPLLQHLSGLSSAGFY
ncbi:Hypothetical protein PHPALM_37593 [Phytophthora palmivora]|uniref:Uncharacterized protein n=1 Tax=Phytophthora palmivora TaxID=4796 RepID=A0A2P4WX25_9STRA|nr:Hypothetical protein PHPALM_37593 [Phytophthora palmivora]